MTEPSLDGPIRILIGSVGRRLYLIDWFEDAFADLGISGEVHISEADQYSAGYLRATHRHLVPRYEDPNYELAMMNLFSQIRPQLFFSVNDYELNVLSSTGLADRLRSFGGIVLALSAEKHAQVHDKLLMADALTSLGISTPRTVLLSDEGALLELSEKSEKLVIKDRYGSGSSGLVLVESNNLALARKWLSTQRGGQQKLESLDTLVVQRAIEGVEYGVDVITSLGVESGEPQVLARKKQRMRAGETDQAETVEPTLFAQLANEISAFTGHHGLIDVDIITEPTGHSYVIDINPRFGGGYPFNHLAGADVPLFYASVAAQVAIPKNWAKYLRGYHSSKYESVVGSLTSETLRS